MVQEWRPCFCSLLTRRRPPAAIPVRQVPTTQRRGIFPIMLPYNLTRPACTAAASLLYLALVSTLIYAIAQTTRADLSMAARESKPGVSPAAALENPRQQFARIYSNKCRIDVEG